MRWDEFFGANGFLDLSDKNEITAARLKAMLRNLYDSENSDLTRASQ